jgi:ketosteroid isomerase-like protein
MPDAAELPAIERLALRSPWALALALRVLFLLPRNWRFRRRVVRRLGARVVELVNRGDLETVLALAFEPDVEIRAFGFPVGTSERFSGHQGLRQVFEEWTAAMGWPVFIVERVIDAADRVLLLDVTFSSRGLASGVETTKRTAGFIATFSPRGRICGWDMYWDWEQARAAAGLRETALR